MRSAEALRAALSDDLRKPKYRGNPSPTSGHCYVASEAAYHLLGGKAAGWTPQRIALEGDTHWYLRHNSGDILDLTADQYDFRVPYEEGIGCGFLTKQPSARAKILITRFREACER